MRRSALIAGNSRIVNGLHKRSISPPQLHDGLFKPSRLGKYPSLVSPMLDSGHRLNPNPNSNFNWRRISWYHPLPEQGDVATHASLLRSCASACALPHGMHIHHRIIRHGLQHNPFVQNLLLHMYCKCGALDEAQSLFAKHSERNVFSWDFLIRAYIHHGSKRKSLELFDQMQHEAVMPDKVIYCSALSACGADPDSFPTGRKMHARIMGSAFLSDIVLRTALVSWYNKCGDLDDAQHMFHGCFELDEVSCNAMIETYVQHGYGEEALRLHEQMQWEGLMENGSTFVSLLSMCVSRVDLPLGKRLHVRIIDSGVESDIRLATALIGMYGRCGGLEVAKKLFATLLEKDVVMWNAMIAVYAQNGHALDAFLLYGQMQQEGVLSNRVTFVSVIQACATEAAFVQGRQVHACIKSVDHDSDLVVGNALVSMYGNCGRIEYAQSVFEKMPEKDVVSWTAMIATCAQHGHVKGAWQILCQMQQEGVVPNEVTLVSVISAYACLADPSECKHLHAWLVANGYACVGDVGNALINLYAKSGSLEDAHDLFSQLPEKDMVSWNALISAYAQNGHGMDALQLFEHMQLEGVLANSVTFANVLTACAEQADLLKGQQMHAQILNGELELDDVLWNSILNMYGKCGVIKNAHSMFNDMAERKLISWNSMIAGCAQHGEGMYALRLLFRMHQEGVKPDRTTLISVLTACSHAGLVDEGQHCCSTMIQNHGSRTTLDHFNCMIDLLGRLGRLTEARYLIVDMPYQPTSVSYTSLLNACRQHVDMELGKFAAKHAFELVPEDTASPVLMSNIYGMSGAEDAIDMLGTRCRSRIQA